MKAMKPEDAIDKLLKLTNWQTLPKFHFDNLSIVLSIEVNNWIT